jgi:hypothetical protein
VAAGAGAQAATCTVPPSQYLAPGFIRGTLRPMNDGSPPPREYTTGLLESIGEHFLAVSGPMTLGTYTGSDTLVGAAAFTAVVFTITDAGAIQDLRIAASSLSHGFDQNVVTAVSGVPAADLPPWPRHLGHRTRYVLEVETVGNADTTADPGDTVGTARMSWITTEIPVWHGAVRAQTVPNKQWVPYPLNARQKRVEDSVVVRFVVGPDGRIMANTPYLFHAGYRDFVQVISEQLKSLRYVPTRIGGCPVASVALETFLFKIQER